MIFSNDHCRTLLHQAQGQEIYESWLRGGGDYTMLRWRQRILTSDTRQIDSWNVRKGSNVFTFKPCVRTFKRGLSVRTQGLNVNTFNGTRTRCPLNMCISGQIRRHMEFWRKYGLNVQVKTGPLRKNILQKRGVLSLRLCKMLVSTVT